MHATDPNTNTTESPDMLEGKHVVPPELGETGFTSCRQNSGEAEH
jgi:hypothetical protein